MARHDDIPFFHGFATQRRAGREDLAAAANPRSLRQAQGRSRGNTTNDRGIWAQVIRPAHQGKKERWTIGGHAPRGDGIVERY